MKSGIQKIFFTISVLMLMNSCNNLPVYNGNLEDLSEQQSVWQYLQVFSIYQDRLPDSSGGLTPDQLFNLINDTLGGGRYTEYKSLSKTAAFPASLEAGEYEYTNKHTVFEITKSTVYLRLPLFDVETFQFFKQYVPFLELYANIVLDLRGNGGGLVSVCDSIVSEFLPYNSEYIEFESRGYISSQMRGITLKEKQRTGNRNPKLRNKNVAVLMDRNSASASEILIAALKDKRSAVLIGDTTYGKGIGQSYITRYGRKMLCITSLTIKGLTNRTGNYHRKGIAPDKLDSDVWEEAEAQYPSDSRMRYLYYAIKTLEPAAQDLQIKSVLTAYRPNLPKTSTVKEIPVGAYVILEDPLNN